MAMKSSNIPTTVKTRYILFYNFIINIYLVLSNKIKKYLYFLSKKHDKYSMENLNGYDIVIRIDELLKIRKETRKMLADVIGKTPQVFVDWKRHNISPTAIDLYKMAKHLGVTYDYLLLGKSDQFPDDIAYALAKLQTLSENERKSIITLIENQVDYWTDALKK